MNSENKETSELLGLGKLKDKLLNLNPLYNRKIRFYTSERLSWDLAELLNKSNPSSIKVTPPSIISSLTEKEKTNSAELNLTPFFEIKPNDIKEEFLPKPFVRLTFSNKPNYYPENQLKIVLNFCLTIDSEPNLSLFRDFEEIIQEYSRVIFQHFSENALCIDGPPGTGKSQLICNLLANSLADQKKVLVICEKEVALKVIYDKLTSIGLNLSIIKINELAQTPQVYRDILNHIENNQPERTNRNYYFDSAKQIADLEEKQASNLKKIANYCQVENEFQTYRQISLQEVYLKFDSKQQLSPTLIQLNKSVKNKEQLEKLKFDLGNYIKQEEEEEKLLNNQQENINIDIDDLEKNSNLLSYAKKYVRNKEKLTLLYHYRSRYPELIEFSNQAFYNGILQIVSASELRRNDYSLIEYHYQTKGCWINTENQVEARYIIELLKTLPPNKEIGIITFNVKQRDLLIDSITEGSNYKNLFIKNLEEVQGDERDIIIFSTGYGPNKEGKIFLNFGPLNNEGGEKRLNVAISRAREKMIIVTSLLPDDLKRITEEDENRKPGPKLFKNGELAEFGSLFEEQVYNELISQNYTLANRIECDGEYWHGKTENIERDIYRQQLLEDKVNFMIILALETSCDETSVAILENKKVLSNITISQILEQQKYGGVMPSLAAKLHIKNIQKVLSNALSKAKISPEKIDYIAYTEKPGLIICLQIGKIVAETLSLYLNKPLITCNHLEGHIYASFHFDFVLLGETLDDAIGECLDKSAILLGYDYPGGPIIEKLALKGKNIYKLPFPKNDESLDFSFSGLKSEISRLVSKERENINANNLACSLQDENYSNELIKKEIEMLTIGKYVNAKHDYLVEVIDNCPKIKFINCCGNFLTDLDFLSNLNSEKITNIHLRNNNISERDLSCFSRLVNLTTLLIGNSVESKIQKGIFNRFTGSLEFLKDLTMLKRLDIRNTDIDSGLEYLPNSVKEFHCSTDERKESKVKEIETELEPFLINSVKSNLQAANQKINDLQQELDKEKGWWDEWLADDVQFINTTLRSGGKQQVYCFLPEGDIYELIDKKGTVCQNNFKNDKFIAVIKL
ncbi:17301_t:CDS:10 [Entrophospora sp. SA101]|nr:17301_t:CDS:10 [Entrophospora sp. SA101]